MCFLSSVSFPHEPQSGLPSSFIGGEQRILGEHRTLDSKRGSLSGAVSVREVVVASDIKLERGSELRSQCDGDCLDSGQDSIHLAA